MIPIEPEVPSKVEVSDEQKREDVGDCESVSEMV
jgi:hypothetical protein